MACYQIIRKNDWVENKVSDPERSTLDCFEILDRNLEFCGEKILMRFLEEVTTEDLSILTKNSEKRA